MSVAAGTAAAGRGRLCAMDTVFNGSTLGIEQHVVEVAPVGGRLVLDNSINSTIYRVLLPLSPCEHTLFPTAPYPFSGLVDLDFMGFC